MKIMKRILLCAAALLSLAAPSMSVDTSIRLTMREKRAACAVAFYDTFSRSFHREEVRQAQKRGEKPTRLYLGAYDEQKREVTPAALITALRRDGFNVHPLWTEKKWTRLKNPKGTLGTNFITLTQFRQFNDGRIQWQVDDWEIEGSHSRSIVEVKKKSGRWIVVNWRGVFTAG